MGQLKLAVTMLSLTTEPEAATCSMAFHVEAPLAALVVQAVVAQAFHLVVELAGLTRERHRFGVPGEQLASDLQHWWSPLLCYLGSLALSGIAVNLVD